MRGDLAAAYGKGSVVLCQRLERSEDVSTFEQVQDVVSDLRTIWECSLSDDACRKRELKYALNRISNYKISSDLEWPGCESFVFHAVRGAKFYRKKGQATTTTTTSSSSSSERHDLGLAYGKGSSMFCDRDRFPILTALATISKCSSRKDNSNICEQKELKIAMDRIDYGKSVSSKRESIDCESDIWILTRSRDFHRNFDNLMKSIDRADIVRRENNDITICDCYPFSLCVLIFSVYAIVCYFYYNSEVVSQEFAKGELNVEKEELIVSDTSLESVEEKEEPMMMSVGEEKGKSTMMSVEEKEESMIMSVEEKVSTPMLYPPPTRKPPPTPKEDEKNKTLPRRRKKGAHQRTIMSSSKNSLFNVMACAHDPDITMTMKTTKTQKRKSFPRDRWNRDTSECEICGDSFGALQKWRHHCRACGRNVCNTCSPNTKVFEEGSERVCKYCEHKEILMQEVKQFKNQTSKQIADYDSKHAAMKRELDKMENELESKLSKLDA